VTCLRSPARPKAGMARVIPALLAAAAVLFLAACEGGAIAQNTPVSNGQSFVQGSYSSTFYAPGSRPAAPAVTGTTLTGQRFGLADDRGSVVVLNFWGAWCSACRQEAPALSALAGHFRNAPVRFVGVDIEDNVPAALAYEHKFNISYPSLNDPGDQVALAFHGTVPPAGFPTTLVIDGSGHIAGRVVGGVSYNGLKALIATVMAGRP
jgi:thiol-disulfide isomerase/thioredoxin